MSRTLLVLVLVLLSGACRADAGPAARVVEAVADLGRVNGLALACREPQVVARAKELMIARVPKTREYGEAFEAATSEAFTRVPGGCPDAAALRLEMEVAASRLQAAMAGQR